MNLRVIRGRGMRFPAALAVGLALRLGPPAPAGAATYFVDNQSGGCSSSGPGTEFQPYCTISAAVSAHRAPDDTILVKPGRYREKVSIPASGAPDHPIVVRALGPGVVIDGSDNFADPALWAPVDGAVWRAGVVTWQPLQVFADGARLTPAAVAPADLPSHAFTWVVGEGLYVNLGGDNPGNHLTLVGRRTNAFSVGGKSWVHLEGFEITRTESRSILLQNDCTDMLLARNHITYANNYGIEVVDGTRVTIEQNVISDGNYHGIGLTAGSEQCVVRENEAMRNVDPAVRRANGIRVYKSDRNTLIGNRLHHNQDSGMFFTSSEDNVSYNNRSWNNGDHGFDHVDAPGTIHNNDVAFGNYKDGFSIEGISPNAQVYNCIAVDNGLTTDEFDMWVNDSSSVGFVSDYNLFWNSTSQEPFKFIDTKYATISGYQAASGQDQHSFQADPRFMNAAAGDFHLRPDSPGIDAGTSAIPDWPSIDAAGDGRVDQGAIPDRGVGPVTYTDIGALEVVEQVGPDEVLLPNPLIHVEDRPRHRPPILGGTAGDIAFSSGRPNPSRGAVEFELEFPVEARVRWEVFDLQGRVVWSEERRLPAGRATLRWNGSNADGARAPNGVYLIRASVNDTVFNRRIVRF